MNNLLVFSLYETVFTTILEVDINYLYLILHSFWWAYIDLLFVASNLLCIPRIKYNNIIVMCWNEHVSLNTFLFSAFVLLLILYNNTYTQYKIEYLHNLWGYLFFISFISMQLVECFIWRNIDNKFYNRVFSTMAAMLIFVQPVISLMMLPNISLRNNLIVAYLTFFVPYFTYKFMTNSMVSRISDKGHLSWLFFDTNLFLYFGWLFFFLFTFVYTQNISGLLFGVILFFISCYNYYKDKTIGSMWCWIINLCMIYYASYLLFYLPFCEKKIC